jgi:hypothetical protein
MPTTRGRLDRVGRALRYLAGVDEKIMDQVPQERAWYAAMGGAVLGTATFATLSMWFAVEEVLGAAYLGALLPAALWFLIILNLDRWIVSSRPGDGWQRFGLLLTRAVLAVLVGIVIAEPLVMRVFETKIVEVIQQDRSERLDDLRGRLTHCNPDPTDDKALRPADCSADDTVVLPGNPKADADELSALRTDVNDIQKSIDADTEALSRINAKARAECVGDKEPGTTGIAGEGPECLLLRKEATQFEASHPLADRTAKLTTIRSRITELEPKVNLARQTFGQDREAAIHRRMAEETQVDDPVGLLERMEALHAISSANATLGIGIIFVRLLFITVDLTPVLMKMTNGKTAYERIVNEQLRDVMDNKRLALKEARQHHERQRQRNLEKDEVNDRVAFLQSVGTLAEAYERGGRAPEPDERDR